MKPPKEWVAGFLFKGEGNTVALIKKERPDWQKGKLNGVGGKVEEGETPLQAMIREFEEETGFRQEEWREYCTLDWKGGRVHFFTATNSEAKLESKTDEEINMYFTSDAMLSRFIIPNLKWLIPMALDKDSITATVSEPDAWNAE